MNPRKETRTAVGAPKPQIAARPLAALTLTPEEIVQDYRLAYRSRQVSVIGRREVLSGKAKFGVFGDGKELAQIALAKVFKKGDWRSGYYRDQTLWFALGAATVNEFFAQLYAHADVQADPSMAGRSMNAHFASRSLKPDGSWNNLLDIYNTSADLSPTGAQMPRLVGLAYASRLYRELAELKRFAQFSHNGDEVAFGIIGNAATSEGMFWEAVNAIGVLRSPAVISIWDDGYGISVPNEHQMVKQNLSELLKGFQREKGSQDGYDLYTVKGWDYPALVETYAKAAETARREHVPAIVHVIELTQPQGHSTSGSHERYKSAERLHWETDFDCVTKFREWIIAHAVATAEELEKIERDEKRAAESSRKKAWEAYAKPIQRDLNEVVDLLETVAATSGHEPELTQIKARLQNIQTPYRRDLMVAVRDALLVLRDESLPARKILTDWKKKLEPLQTDRYSSHLYSESVRSALRVPEVKPFFSERSPILQGFEILNACFDKMLARDPRVIAFGEDVGHLGDVNQGFAGLQAKHGVLRVSDTGIRETTILGQAIGLALRGLRPICEIQYLDYILYALQTMSDDLASLHWRTKGGQAAPVIIRTRGHRLEGIWHSGSPMAGVMHLVRGLHILVPRNMTQAAGFYNTLLKADEPALVVEVLNGYRLKEKLPDNIGEFTVPLGVPEILREGNDLTIVTYGACCRLALEAADLLQKVGIDIEVIDVQSLLPFDVQGRILDSLKKTSRILFLDEDVPGGTTAYMLQEVIEKQGGFYHLDTHPRTLSAKAHRPAYGSDGDYWSKPNVEQIFETVYDVMHESDPATYPMFYR
jgi:pyruvate/2-oxoglutarate/acetoin dehydrogenase E1 component/TPP-dependent pyruvate/acetoin dehydrogenase alpha subunit